LLVTCQHKDGILEEKYKADHDKHVKRKQSTIKMEIHERKLAMNVK